MSMWNRSRSPTGCIHCLSPTNHREEIGMKILVDASLHDADHHRNIPHISLADRPSYHDFEQIKHLLRNRASTRFLVQSGMEDRPIHRIQRVALFQRRVALAERLRSLPRGLLRAQWKSLLLLGISQRCSHLTWNRRARWIVSEQVTVWRYSLRCFQDGVVHLSDEIPRKGLCMLKEERNLVENRIQRIE